MIRFLTDEQLPRALARALERRGLEVTGVQEVGLRSTPDSDILRWAAEHDYVLVSKDRKTMRAFVEERVAAGLPCPGVALIRGAPSLGELAESLHVVAACSFPGELRDRVTYVPLRPSA